MKNKKGSIISTIGKNHTIVLHRKVKTIGKSIYDHAFRQDQLDHTRVIINSYQFIGGKR